MICDKIAYDNHKDANDHIKGMNKRKGGSYRSYKCKECGKFHVCTIKTKGRNNNNKHGRRSHSENAKLKNVSMSPLPKKSVIQKSIQTTYKPFEYLRQQNNNK